MSIKIGVLALQGDFNQHGEVLRSLGVSVQEVRKPKDLECCRGLIIPGGESTAMLKQIEFIQMRDPLLAFAKERPLFGTCAGLILMSRNIRSSLSQSLQKVQPSQPLPPLELLDIEVERNAFGRQADSFQTSVFLELLPGDRQQFPAIFIRAPRIREWGDKVEVLASFNDEPILVRQGNHLGASFHPELTSNSYVHQFFVEVICK